MFPTIYKNLQSPPPYEGRFVSKLFNQKKSCFNPQKYFQPKKTSLQWKKKNSIIEKQCLNAKKYLRSKKLHLNTVFLWLKRPFLIEVSYYLIENSVFDWSHIFCIWAILWVGYLCLYYSIPKNTTSIKKYIFNQKKLQFNNRKKKSIKEKQCLNAKAYLRQMKLRLNTFFFWLKCKKFWSLFFFLIESFWHKYSALGGCFPIGQTCLSDKCPHQWRLT